MAVARQRPSTANGVVFMLLEDELGQLNLIVPPPVYERHRAVVRGEPLLLAHGRFERGDRNQNVVVDRLETLGPLAREVAEIGGCRSRFAQAHHFRPPLKLVPDVRPGAVAGAPGRVLQPRGYIRRVRETAPQ